MKFQTLILLFWFPFEASAQFHFKEKSDIPVTISNTQLVMPWAGGINAAQFQKMDVNNDGIEDLVIYDRTSKRISVFEASNSQFIYTSDYTNLFPQDIDQWVMLRDYDCDGDKDLFTSSIFGMKAYENAGFNGAEINWILAQDPINTLGFSSVINLQMNGSDIPSIEDIDGDGDLDILVFDFAGSGGIEMHENQGGCGTFDYVRLTKTWGEFTECQCSTYDFGEGCTDIPAGKLTHQAAYSMLVKDFNNDGQVDLVMSQEDCKDLDFLPNVGSSKNAILDEFYKGFPVNQPAIVDLFPSAFMEDVDFDGIQDLLISTNSSSTFDLEFDYLSTSTLYKNTGTNSTPNFQFIQEKFLQEDMIDVGENAYPAFFDFDNDGDNDLFVGTKGSTYPDGFYSAVHYFENTGTDFSPAFVLRETDFANISSRRLTHIKPLFADMNRDGKKDLAFTGTIDFSQTEFYFIPNSSAIPGSNEFLVSNILITSLPLSEGDTPAFFNYDDDVYEDLLVGRNSGALDLYVSTGSGSFTLLQSSFLGVGASPSRRNVSPAIADLNGDGNPDLILSDTGGKVKIFSNFLSTQSLPSESLSWLENEVLEKFVDAGYGVNAHITAAQVTSNDLPEIIIGSAMGGLHILENKMEGTPSAELQVRIYPNPVFDNAVRILVNKTGMLNIYNLAGSLIHSGIVIRREEILELNTTKLLPGIYLFKLVTGEQTETIRVAIL